MNMNIQRIISLVKETQGIIRNREMAAHVREKGVADYVTQVDIAVQDFLQKALYALAPDIQFLGEETGLQRMDTGNYWILDPVDGTTNLVHDYQHSVVSLALCCQKEIVLGIVYDPFHDELFSAVKGEGELFKRQTHTRLLCPKALGNHHWHWHGQKRTCPRKFCQISQGL